MTLDQLLDSYNLDRSVLIGYYGGGNYGDELLLEVLMNIFKKRNLDYISVTHQKPIEYTTYHHDFGYALVPMHDKKKLLRAIAQNKNVVIGGGGLWGMDMNFNVFLLSLLLFISRWAFGKRVFLLGVGYYNSTSRLGRIGAWLAGKAATHIIARDQETFANFRRITKHVSQDRDIAWQLKGLDLKRYQPDTERIDKQLQITKKTLFITLRRFKPSANNAYVERIKHCLQNNPDKPIILALLEPRSVDPAGYKQITKWRRQYKNVQVFDFSANPIALLLFFKKHQRRLALIGPQFHIIITAKLAGVPFFRVAYDNKVTQLLNQLGETSIPIKEVSDSHLQHYINGFYRGNA